MGFISLLMCLSILPFGSLPGVFADEENNIEVRRLSERVIVLTENSPIELNVTAIVSEAGIVVVDTTYSPAVAKKIREIIEREFGRSDFAYVINTHHHWDHWLGNQAFTEAQIIAHETAPNAMRRTATPRGGGPHPAPWLLDMARQTREQLEQLDPDSSEAEGLRKRIAWNEQTHQELTGFELTLPNITFSDRLSIGMGDLTLNIYFYGQADTANSIVVHVPEEKLFCAGDLYWIGGAFSDFDDGLTLGVPKWIEVLNAVLANEGSIENVVCGHKNIWPRRCLELRRDYIVDLWNGVKAAKEEGLNLEATKARLPIEKFAYMDELQFGERLKELDIPKEMLPGLAFSRRHVRNVEVFRRQLQESAAAILEQTIDESGLEAALAGYEAIKADLSDKYYFEENRLNALGYRLMSAGLINEAIAIFQINVEQFPESWNVYDSLAEGYLNNRQIELSIENYRKSLELNPQNENAIYWLGELERNATDFQNETREPFGYTFGENTGLQGPYLGQDPPGLEPEIFAPGLISTGGVIEFSSTFTPDGREYYFNRGPHIMVCYWTEDGWTAPEFAPFNTENLDHEAHITPDGGKMFFGSRRPRSDVPPGEDPYGIWVMIRTKTGWGEPRYHGSGMYVTTTNDGTIYVTDIGDIAGGGVVRSRFVAGQYAEMEKLGGGINSPALGVHSCIAPDESFIIFDSTREGGQGGDDDLYICFRNDDGSWGEAINLGDTINTEGADFVASLSPDGKYLFYCTYRDIYWVSTEILKKLKPE
jgi:glyoxylase-like metal-dependent hydrolase (beta-lactamase superfamily II)